MEYIAEGEYVEVTPQSIRLRKIFLKMVLLDSFFLLLIVEENLILLLMVKLMKKN